jgi:predicted RND superfamily exporter protein
LRLRERTQLRPVTLAEVPHRLKLPFHEKDGKSGRLVLVFPTLQTDSHHGKAQIAHAKLVRRAALKADPKALIAGQIVLTSDIVDSITKEGGFAVTLCSATTIIGYATLVTADSMAIQSFGLTAVIGELTCLSAALFALPAVLAWRDRRRTVQELPPQEVPKVEPLVTDRPRREAQGL